MSARRRHATAVRVKKSRQNQVVIHASESDETGRDGVAARFGIRQLASWRRRR